MGRNVGIYHISSTIRSRDGNRVSVRRRDDHALVAQFYGEDAMVLASRFVAHMTQGEAAA